MTETEHDSLPCSPCISKIAQSCPTLCDPVDCSPPGSSVHGILQARILEWVAISFSRGSSQPRDQTHVSRIAGRCLSSNLPSGHNITSGRTVQRFPLEKIKREKHFKNVNIYPCHRIMTVAVKEPTVYWLCGSCDWPAPRCWWSCKGHSLYWFGVSGKLHASKSHFSTQLSLSSSSSLSSSCCWCCSLCSHTGHMSRNAHPFSCPCVHTDGPFPSALLPGLSLLSFQVCEHWFLNVLIIIAIIYLESFTS